MVVPRNSPTHSPSREKPVSKKNLGMASVQWTGLKVLYSGIPLSWASQVANGREPASQCRRRRRPGFNPWVRKIPWSRKRQPTPVFLPRKSHDRRAWQATVHRVAKSQTCLSMSTWSLERWYWWTYLQGRNRVTDIQNGPVDTAGKEVVGNTERVLLTYTLSCIK